MVSTYLLETALREEYPRQRKLGDDAELSIRPLTAADESALYDYFQRIPAVERNRFFRDNVVDPVLVGEWCRRIDLGQVIPLVALDEGRIVADGTLHLEPAGIKSHVGRLRISVDPDYRGRGAGSVLVSELLDLAPLAGLTWVDAEAVASDSAAVAALQGTAFKQMTSLPDHARDGLGNIDDVLIFTRQVERVYPEEIGGEG